MWISSNIGKDLIQDKLYQLIDQFHERKITPVGFYSRLLKAVRPFYDANGRTSKMLFFNNEIMNIDKTESTKMKEGQKDQTKWKANNVKLIFIVLNLIQLCWLIIFIKAICLEPKNKNNIKIERVKWWKGQYLFSLYLCGFKKLETFDKKAPSNLLKTLSYIKSNITLLLEMLKNAENKKKTSVAKTVKGKLILLWKCAVCNGKNIDIYQKTRS